MGNAKDVMWETSGKHAMGAWKERQRERPMQGPPTEIQMLRAELEALRAELEALRRQHSDNEMAAALTELENHRGRIRL